MFVIGTAGHVDHGKSTLIKALTGIDPDRLREEKERQMTIDLGFAWLKLPDGEEIGIIDVPGHRDFIDNMLAGSGGIDAALFIIAADEGIMPQSREHLSILELLEIKYGIIVLTKIDLISDQEWLDMVKLDITKFVTGTFLENSPMIEVSAATGQGINELLITIAKLPKKIIPKKDLNRPRLPIDRVFTLKGFGTVVTGTLLDGQFSLGQQVEILPQKIKTRIRGIQSHKKALKFAEPGSRTALNLIGVDVQDIFRGNIVAPLGLYQPTRRIDVRFKMLKDTRAPLIHDDYVKFYTGTSQISARVRLIGSEAIGSNENGWLQLELEKPLIVAKGDHFILRRPSPGETLGGGIVLDKNPKKRLKRFSNQSTAHFRLLESGSVQDIILSQIQSGEPKTVLEISEIIGHPLEKINAIISRMLQNELVALIDQNNHITANTLITTKANFGQLQKSILITIQEFHNKFPLRQGIPKDELRRSIGLSPRIFGIYSELLNIRNELLESGDVIFLPNHSTDFTEKDLDSVKEIMERMKDKPFSPPSITDLTNEFNSEIIRALIIKGFLVQTSDDIVFRKEDYEEMFSGLKEFLKLENAIALNQFRDLFHTSRKYALSFLEYLDRNGITSREGDTRILRAIDKE